VRNTVAVTLPAPPVPESAERNPPRRGLPAPVALVALVVLSTVIVVACVLGATFSGLAGFVKGTSAASPPPSASFVAPAPRQATRFGDGIWLVGSDILTGTYTATVPVASPGCAWARTASADDAANSVVESGTGRDGETIVATVVDTDTSFQTDGCGEWRRTGD
jgi:hypothetical protein